MPTENPADIAQFLALFIAGYFMPKIQEWLIGNKVHGTLALWFNGAACYVIALAAMAVTGAFGGLNPQDPGAYISEVIKSGTLVAGLSQIVFQHTIGHQQREAAKALQPPTP